MANRINTLEAARAKAHAGIKAIRDAAIAENRPMTAEEREQVKAFEAEIAGIDEDIQAEQRFAAREQAWSGRDADQAAARAAEQAAGIVGSRIEMGADRSTLDPTGGFPTLAHFARSVREAFTPGGTVDRRLAGRMATPSNYHQGTGGSAGEGYAVPAQHRDQLFELAFPGDDLVSAMQPEPTDSNAVDIEADETTPWGASGVQARWRAEATQMTATKTEQELRTVRLQELYAFVKATDELLADSPRLQNRITVKSAQAIRWKASDAVVNGNGAGIPLGWMQSGALVTQTKESGQAAATIVAKNVLKMYSRLISEGGQPFWLAHSSTLPEIATMTIGDQPVWTPPNQGMKEAPNGLLLGLPVRFSEHAQTVGTKGDLHLVNPAGYYATVKRGEGVQFASSIHLYFDYNMTAFRWTFRLGGQPFLKAPMARANGSQTKSHFVVLETRS